MRVLKSSRWVKVLWVEASKKDESLVMNKGTIVKCGSVKLNCGSTSDGFTRTA